MPMRSVLGKHIWLAALLAISAPGAALAGSAPASLSPAGAAAVTLEICRLPGSIDENSSAEIDIPAGVTFTADAFDDVVNPELRGNSVSSSLQVVTAARVALTAGTFCVRAPVKPLGSAGPAAIEAALGRMFVVTGGATGSAGAEAFDSLYGLLRSGNS